MVKERVKKQLDTLEVQEERILRLLKDERSRASKKFPLLYAFLATFGLVATIAGLNKFIEEISWLKDDPLYLTALGLTILLITGAAYRKLG